MLAQQLLATNANAVINFNGGTLVSQSTTISNGQDFYIGSTGGNATFIANGGTHTFQNYLYIDGSSSGSQLVISNGATVVSKQGRIGFDLGTSNNVVTVTGVGSVWSNTAQFLIGYYGANNALTIANGGNVSAPAVGEIGFSSFANSVTVTGTGSASIPKFFMSATMLQQHSDHRQRRCRVRYHR